MSTGTSTIYATPAQDRTTFLIFCFYTFVLIGRPQDFIPSLASLRIALLFTVFILFFTMFQKSEGIRGIFRYRESRLYLLFFGIMCAGIPFSLYRRASFNFIILLYSANVVFYTLFLLHVNTIERFKWVVAVLMFSGLIFSVFGLLQGGFHGGRYDTGSHIFDPNDIAFVAICFFSFELSVLLGSFRILTKIIALISLLLSMLLTLYTGSRGGLLGFIFMLLLFLLLKLLGVKKSHKVLLTVLFIAAAVINADKINMERYSTLGEIGNDYNVTDEFGREHIWRRGLQLFFEKPITGVGVTGFSEAIGTMRAKENLQQVWSAPHNSYLQVLVETGIFGIIVFFFLIVNCLKIFNKFRKRRETSLEREFSAMSGALFIGFIALLITASFLSQAYSTLFTLFFAISASLNRIEQADTEKRPYA